MIHRTSHFHAVYTQNTAFVFRIALRPIFPHCPQGHSMRSISTVTHGHVCQHCESLPTCDSCLCWTAGDGDVAVLDGDEVITGCHRRVGEFVAFFYFLALDSYLGGTVNLGVESSNTRVGRHYCELSLLACMRVRCWITERVRFVAAEVSISFTTRCRRLFTGKIVYYNFIIPFYPT